MSRRMIFHNLPALISVGAEVSDEGNVYVSLSACRHDEDPHRSVANKILKIRLGGSSDAYRSFVGRYEGKDVGKEVMGPIRDAVRSLRKRRSVSGVMKRIKASVEASCSDNLMPLELNLDKPSTNLMSKGSEDWRAREALREKALGLSGSCCSGQSCTT